MFLTLTCDSYGRVHEDGTPVHPESYDYRRAARDAVHFASLVDRWWQNLRRVVGWDVQYFATIEPQRRAAPHLHTALRGSIPHDVIRQVTAATYHQVWWPTHDKLIYTGNGRMPVWEPRLKDFTDPDTRQPLTSWAEALDRVEQPAHVVTFGEQVHSKGILGGTDDAGRHIGYLTKYLVKSISEIVTQDTEGLSGRRVLVSRKWSGKTLADHRADRMAFVTQALAAVGIEKPAPDTARLIWRKLAPGDQNVPPRAHLLLHAIAERIRWRAEYDRAMLAATGPPPSTANVSAVPEAA
jgi:hypothetical protein